MTIGGGALGGALAGAGKSASKKTKKAAPSLASLITGAGVAAATSVAAPITTTEIKKFVEGRREEAAVEAAQASAPEQPKVELPRIGDRVYWSQEANTITRANTGVPLYWDSKKEQVTFDPTPLPYIYGTVPRGGGTVQGATAGALATLVPPSDEAFLAPKDTLEAPTKDLDASRSAYDWFKKWKQEQGMDTIPIAPPTSATVFARNEGGAWQPYVLSSAPKGLFEGFAAVTTEPFQGAVLPSTSPAWDLFYNGLMFVYESTFWAGAIQAMPGAKNLFSPDFVSQQTAQAKYYGRRIIESWNNLWSSEITQYQIVPLQPESPQETAAKQAQADLLRTQAYATLSDLRTSGDFIATEDYQVVREDIRRAIQLDRETATWDPYNSFSWAAHPEKEELFIDAAIDAEIQLGRPMTKWEVVSLRRGFEDINAQFVGEVVFDWSNLIPVALMDKFIVAPFKQVLANSKEAIELMKTAKWLEPVVSFFTERAVGSAARQIRDGAHIITADLARSASSIQDVVAHLDEYAQVLGRRSELNVLELSAELRKINPDLGPAQINYLIRMSDAITPVTADGVGLWGTLLENARKTKYADLYEKEIIRLRGLGYLTEEIISQRAALKAGQLADDPKQLAPLVASIFEQRLRQNHAVPWSRLLNDDALSFKAISWLEKQSGGLPQQGLRSAADALARASHFVHRVWVQAVLSARPAWVARNFIDSTFRYLVYGGRAFGDWETLRLPYARGDKVFPVDFVGSFATEFLPGSSSVEARMIYEGKFPGGFFSEWGNVFKAKGWKALNPVEVMRTWKNSWMDMNRAIEFSLRVRLFEQTASKVIGQLSPLALEKALETLPDAARPMARQIWTAANGDPQRFATLLDSVLGNANAGRPVWRNVVPDAVRNTFLGTTLDSEVRAIGPVAERLNSYISRELERGISLEKIDFDGFFDDVMENVRDFTEKRGIATKAIVEAGGDIPTVPNLTNTMEDAMAAMLDEESIVEAARQEAKAASDAAQEVVYDATQRAPGGSMYTPEQEAIIRGEQEAVFARFFDQVAQANIPVEAKSILERQVSQYRDYFSRLQRFRLEVMPGPLFQSLGSAERKIAWDQVAQLRTAAAQTVSSTLDELFNVISKLTPEEAKAVPELVLDDFLETIGMTIARDESGAVLSVRQSLPNIPTMPSEWVSTSQYTRTAFQSILERAAEEIKPIVEVTDEALVTGATVEATQDLGQAWVAWANAQDLFKQYGTKARSYNGFIQYINEQIKVAKAMGTEEGSILLAAWERRKKEARQVMEYIRQFRFDDLGTLSPPPLPRWEMSEGVQTWLRDQDLMAADFAAIQDAFTVWRNEIKAGVTNGSLLVKTLDPAVNDALKGWSPVARDFLSEIQNVAYYGGSSQFLPSGAFEGAIPFTNRVMLDYTSFSRFDQTMKGIIPFWMFPSRSIPFWIETMALRPQIPAFYAKYMRTSQRFALQRGGLRAGISSMGEPLPSLEGYIPIPGTDIWVNPTSALSFRYLFPRQTERYDEADEDANMFKQVLQGLHQSSNQFGFSLPPWLTWVLYRTDVLDPNLTPEQGWIPQTALIPPNFMRALNRMLNQVNAPFELPEYWEPQVSWKDFLVERRVLTTANQRILDGAGVLSSEQKLQIATEAWEALREREGNALYDAARDQLDNENWVADVAGYFTGQYGKIFSDADAYLIQLRIYNNRLKESINNQVAAQLFGLDETADERYKFYYDNFNASGEGILAGLMGNISFVTDPENDMPLYGLDRRRALEGEWKIKINQDAYYNQLTTLTQTRDAALLALPVGAPSAITDKIWDEYFRQVDLANTKYPFPRKSYNLGYFAEDGAWVPGLHTPEQIQDHFAGEWFRMVKQTEPTWNPEKENYLEFKARHDVWLNDLPRFAPLISRSLFTLLRNQGIELPPELQASIAENLRSITNAEGLKQYQLQHDTAWEAIEQAWRTLRWDPYWDMVENLGGARREQAQNEYLQKYGETLTMEQAMAWISQTYGGRFTEQEIRDAFLGRDQFDAQSRQEAETAVSFGEEIAVAESDIWDLLSLATILDKSTDLRNALALAGGDPDYIDVWYTVGGNLNAFRSTEEIIAFRDKLKQAAAMLNFTQPTALQIEEKAAAEVLNEQFNKLASQQLGAALQVQSVYLNLTPSARSEFRKNNPEQYALVQAIYDLKDQFAAANPVWAKYYWPSASVGGGGSSGGGGSQSAAGVTYIYQAPRELYGMNSSDKEKLKLYYEGKKGLAANFKKRLEQIWIDLGKPGGSLNNWIWGALRRRFTLVKKSKKKGKGGRSGGQRGGGQRSSYSTSPGNADQQAPLRIGMRSTLDATELLDDARLGKGGLAETP